MSEKQSPVRIVTKKHPGRVAQGYKLASLMKQRKQELRASPVLKTEQSQVLKTKQKSLVVSVVRDWFQCTSRPPSTLIQVLNKNMQDPACSGSDTSHETSRRRLPIARRRSANRCRDTPPRSFSPARPTLVARAHSLHRRFLAYSACCKKPL